MYFELHCRQRLRTVAETMDVICTKRWLFLEIKGQLMTRYGL